MASSSSRPRRTGFPWKLPLIRQLAVDSSIWFDDV
jgi:hypothetical protein